MMFDNQGNHTSLFKSAGDQPMLQLSREATSHRAKSGAANQSSGYSMVAAAWEAPQPSSRIPSPSTASNPGKDKGGKTFSSQ